jgi:hypothetical protein
MWPRIPGGNEGLSAFGPSIGVRLRLLTRFETMLGQKRRKEGGKEKEKTFAFSKRDQAN